MGPMVGRVAGRAGKCPKTRPNRVPPLVAIYQVIQAWTMDNIACCNQYSYTNWRVILTYWDQLSAIVGAHEESELWVPLHDYTEVLKSANEAQK